ncbi:MAG: DTW domain-containing protein, partial [Colwellia sp.]|nr:DTW domain-containing protein [Colwellia sp.]
PQFTLKMVNNSLYKLRANQPKGGLCTIECIIEVLRLKGQNKMAAELSIKFEQFNG